MAQSAASIRLRWPEPIPWTLSVRPMTIALERVKQATVQLKTVASSSSADGFRADTTSTSPGF